MRGAHGAQGPATRGLRAVLPALLLTACVDGSVPAVQSAEEQPLVVEAPPTDFIEDAVWSGDGRRIVAAWTRGSRSRLVGLLGPSDEGVPPSPATGLPVTEGQGRSPSWHPGRMWVAFESHRDGNGEIYRVRPDGMGPENLTGHPAADGDPAYSPDGRRIAFTSDRDGGASQLFVMAADGTGARSLGAMPAEGGHRRPVWSPDGRWIVYSATVGTGQEVFVVAADGAGSRRVGPGSSPSWTADGRQILFVQDNTIFEVPAVGGQPQVLVADGFAPRASPDGRWLLFVRGNRPTSSLYLLDLESLAETRITP